PRTVMHTDAPTSPRSAKLRSNSSRTWENRREQKPEIAMITPPISCPAVSIGLAVHRPVPGGPGWSCVRPAPAAAPAAADRTARGGVNGPDAARGISEPDPGEQGRPRAGGLRRGGALQPRRRLCAAGPAGAGHHADHGEAGHLDELPA